MNYTMLLFWTNHDMVMWEKFMTKRDREYVHPKIPEFPEGAATWVLDENERTQALDPVTERAITHIHKHHNNNLAELKLAYSALEAERAAHRAELEANPPQPRDIYLRVSRLTPAEAAAWHQHALKSKGGHQ